MMDLQEDRLSVSVTEKQGVLECFSLGWLGEERSSFIKTRCIILQGDLCSKQQAAFTNSSHCCWYRESDNRCVLGEKVTLHRRKHKSLAAFICPTHEIL